MIKIIYSLWSAFQEIIFYFLYIYIFFTTEYKKNTEILIKIFFLNPGKTKV